MAPRRGRAPPTEQRQRRQHRDSADEGTHGGNVETRMGCPLSWIFTDVVAKDQIIDVGLQEASHRVVRRADDRLLLDVEGRVEDERYTGQRLELLQQRPVSGVLGTR